MEIVQDIIRGNLESVEHDNRIGVRNIVAIAIGNKSQFRRISNPNSAVAYGDSGKIPPFVPKHFSPIKPTVVIRVFQNQNAITGSVLFPHRVRVILNNPQPSPIIEIKRDRSPEIRLTGEERHSKTVRHGNAFQRFSR